MAIKLKATSSFSGNEGFVKSGDVFEVDSQERADKLVKDLELAEYADEGAEVTNEGDLSYLNKTELQDRAAALEIDGYKSMTKAELVEAINNAESENTSGDIGTEPAPDGETDADNNQ